ncbi:MAG: nucleotide sugar dehydrogenase [Hyphomicrobium sp.]
MSKTPVRDDEITYAALREKINSGAAVIGIYGLGYVGLPLALAIAERSRFSIVGFDIDPAKIEALAAGQSYFKHLPEQSVARMVASGRFTATTDMSRTREIDIGVLCVPTPLSRQREPDLSYVTNTVRSLLPHAKPGQLLVLESTTYPGTTREVLGPICEAANFTIDQDYFLAFSPEREDPGNANFHTATIPKIVGADGARSRDLAVEFYRSFIERVVPVSSAACAEAVKLTENVFRAVNIALVNELKVIYGAMGIDVWEVIEAAKTKPFGYMPFYPGPGLGGHCIPIDPFYLTWKAREYEISTRFIELSGEINRAMPRFVVDRLAEALDCTAKRGLNGARVLIIGLAYKKNVDDLRESPSLKLIELIEGRGGEVSYHDPFFPAITATREHSELAGRRSTPINAAAVAAFDAVLISTDHDAVDYALLAEHAKLIVDTRNVFERLGLQCANLVKA